MLLSVEKPPRISGEDRAKPGLAARTYSVRRLKPRLAAVRRSNHVKAHVAFGDLAMRSWLLCRSQRSRGLGPFWEKGRICAADDWIPVSGVPGRSGVGTNASTSAALVPDDTKAIRSPTIGIEIPTACHRFRCRGDIGFTAPFRVPTRSTTLGSGHGDRTSPGVPEGHLS